MERSGNAPQVPHQALFIVAYRTSTRFRPEIRMQLLYDHFGWECGFNRGKTGRGDQDVNRSGQDQENVSSNLATTVKALSSRLQFVDLELEFCPFSEITLKLDKIDNVGFRLLLFLPRVLVRWIALLTAASALIVSVHQFCVATDVGAFKTIVRIPWIPMLGVEYHLASDGISLTMVLVTGLTAVSAVLFSWDVDQRPNEFFFWLLLVVGGSYGVFLSADLFLLFVFLLWAGG